MAMTKGWELIPSARRQAQACRETCSAGLHPQRPGPLASERPWKQGPFRPRALASGHLSQPVLLCGAPPAQGPGPASRREAIRSLMLPALGPGTAGGAQLCWSPGRSTPKNRSGLSLLFKAMTPVYGVSFPIVSS